MYTGTLNILVSLSNDNPHLNDRNYSIQIPYYLKFGDVLKLKPHLNKPRFIISQINQ